MRDEVTLEGMHALKHAARFGAHITKVLTDDLASALSIADQLAPELRPLLEDQAQTISTTQFRQLATQPINTHILANAERPNWTFTDTLPTIGHPTILLDDPRNTKNLGAVVRVGAAADAAGLMVSGPADLYNPMAVRGAAGLQWALPCWGSPTLLAELASLAPLDQLAQLDQLTQLTQLTQPTEVAQPVQLTQPATPFSLIGLDAEAAAFDPTQITEPVIFAFGSERSGLSQAVRSACTQIVSLPMRPQVSSLNLATSVSAVLYLLKYAQTAY